MSKPGPDETLEQHQDQVLRSRDAVMVRQAGRATRKDIQGETSIGQTREFARGKAKAAKTAREKLAAEKAKPQARHYYAQAGLGAEGPSSKRPVGSWEPRRGLPTKTEILERKGKEQDARTKLAEAKAKRTGKGAKSARESLRDRRKLVAEAGGEKGREVSKTSGKEQLAARKRAAEKGAAAEKKYHETYRPTVESKMADAQVAAAKTAGGAVEQADKSTRIKELLGGDPVSSVRDSTLTELAGLGYEPAKTELNKRKAAAAEKKGEEDKPKGKHAGGGLQGALDWAWDGIKWVWRGRPEQKRPPKPTSRGNFRRDRYISPKDKRSGRERLAIRHRGRGLK